LSLIDEQADNDAPANAAPTASTPATPMRGRRAILSCIRGRNLGKIPASTGTFFVRRAHVYAAGMRRNRDAGGRPSRRWNLN
jgi:hypothetical protein